MSLIKRKPRTPPKPSQDYYDNNYGHVEVKMKNICCVFCKKTFVLKDHYRFGKRVIPLTRSCGHAICDMCSKIKANEACPICNDTLPPAGEAQMSQPLLNVYVMGLLNINRSRSIQSDEPKINFEKSLQAKARTSSGVVERCVECGDVARVKCVPCKSNTYCKGCFTLLHQYKTNKDHLMTPLDQDLANLVNLPVFCNEHKDTKFKHWCEDCEEPCCPDCAIEIHRAHSIIKLRAKNREMLQDLEDAYNNLAATLLYTKDSKKRVTAALKVPQELESIGGIEAEINQHFLHLHGVLQNMEGKMIETLRAQRNQQQRNLQEINKVLEGMEKDIEAAIVEATSVENQFDYVHLADVVQKLVTLAKSSCYFAQDPVKHSENIRFHSKILDIIPCLEGHCNLEVVPTPQTAHLLPRTSHPIDSLPDLATHITEIPQLFTRIDFPQRMALSSASLSSLASSTSIPSTEAETHRPPHAAIPLLLDTSNRKNYCDVYVTHIESPANFYMRYASDNVKWTTVQEKLKSYNNSDGIIPDEIKMRQTYAVKSDDNDDWQRATVIGVVPDHEKDIKTYDVLFIDIGSQEKGVLLENIRELDESLQQISPLAENHSLFDVYPRNKTTWDPEACEAFQEVVQNAGNSPLIMRKMEETSHGVDLLGPNKKKWHCQSIRDHLIFMELASWMTHERLYKMNPNSVAILHDDGFKLEEFTQAYMTEIYDPDATPNNMFVRRASYTESTFRKMMNDLQEDYDRTKHTRGKIYTPDVGLICAARSQTKTWYRAVIVATPGQRNVEVFYVDYGVKDIIKYNCLRQLDTSYMKAATRAIKISLRDVAPVNGVWSPDVMDQLREWMKNSVKLIAYDKIGDYYSVSLLDTLTQESLNARLVKMGYAESTGPASRPPTHRRIPEMISSPESIEPAKLKLKRHKSKSKKSKKRLNSLSDNTSITTKNPSKDSVPMLRDIKEDDPWKVHVKPLRVISPDEIYVSPFDIEEKYREMDKKLQRAYRTYPTIGDCIWSVGNVCVIHLRSSNVYRRAEITEIKSPDEVAIYLLDVGDTLIMSLQDLHPLYSDFNDFPANVFQVKLGGIHPPGGSTTWPTASCDKLKEIVETNQGSRFFISKVTEDEGSPMIVDFFVEEVKSYGAIDPTVREINVINRKLVDEGLALPIRNFNDKRIKILGADVEKELDIGDKNPGLPDQDIVECKESVSDSDDSDDSGTIRDINSDDSDVPNDEPIFHSRPVPEGGSSWPPAEPIPHDEFIGEAFFVDWGGFVYFMTPENSEKAMKINAELQQIYERNEDITSINDWKLGDLCIARMHHHNTWHRAQVIGWKNNYLVIRFVDYGNIEWTRVSFVRKKLIFEDVPILVNKCKIRGMAPDNQFKQWIKLDLDKIHYTLVQRKWRVEVVNRLPEYSVVVVTYPTPPHENVLDIMRKKFMIGVTTVKSSSSDTDGIDDSDVIVEEVIDVKTCDNNHEENFSEKEILLSEIDLDGQYVSDSPEESVSYDEVVSAYREKLIEEMYSNTDQIYSNLSLPDDVPMFHGALGEVSAEKASVVWVHASATPGCEYLTTLAQMYRNVMEEMSAEAADQPELENFDEGTPCCAIYDVDHNWYRGRVMSAMGDGDTQLVEVKFVDWGNSQWVRPSDLRLPQPGWLKIPAMAIKCYLHAVRVTGDNITARESLKKFGTSKTKPLTITVEGREGDCLSVELFGDKECETLLYQPLMEKGMFKRDVKKILEQEFV